MTDADARAEIAERVHRAATVAVFWTSAHVMPLLVVSQLVMRFRAPLGAEWSSVMAYLVLFPLVAGLQGAVISSVGQRGVRWAVVTLASLLVALAIGVVVMATAEGHGSETIWMHAAWLVAGTVLGAGQWLEARRWLPRASRWIIASAAGWVGGAAVWSLLWRWRDAVSEVLPLRALVGGLDLPGNVELSIIAVTLVAYSSVTAGVLARFATRGVDE